MVMKTKEAAQKLAEHHKTVAKEQMDFEKGGTLRYTVFDPLPIEGSEEFVVINIAGFKDEAAHKAH
jgi:hypothetical protein